MVYRKTKQKRLWEGLIKPINMINPEELVTKEMLSDIEKHLVSKITLDYQKELHDLHDSFNESPYENVKLAFLLQKIAELSVLVLQQGIKIKELEKHKDDSTRLDN